MIINIFNNIQLPLKNTSINDKHEIISECILAIDEGFNNILYINTTTDTIREMVIEILNMIHDKLLLIWEKLSQLISAFIMNSVTALKRLRKEIPNIEDRFFDNIKVNTYEYPKLYKLPNIKKVEPDSDFITKNIEKSLEKDIYDRRELRDKIDSKIDKFASDVLNEKVKVHSNIKESMEFRCEQLMQGKKTLIDINKTTILDYIDNIIDYKELKGEVTDTKHEINDYYHKLKSSMMKYFKTDSNDNLKYINSAGKMDVINSQDFTYIKVEMNRLFNGYIDIYNIAFNSKLKYMDEYINTQRKTVLEIIKIIHSPLTSAQRNKVNKITTQTKDIII